MATSFGLINLDVTKPPPIPSAATPVDLVPVDDHRALQTSTQPTIVPRLNTAPPIAKGPLCKICGASYNRWSLFHSWGSGLCRRCEKVQVQPDKDPIWQKPVKTAEDAYKVIRITAIYFIVCAVINWCLGFVWMPIVVLCGVGALWHLHSRAAAILLIVLSTLDIVSVLLMGGGYPGMLIGVAIGGVELGLSIRSLEAVRKLRKGFTPSSS